MYVFLMGLLKTLLGLLIPSQKLKTECKTTSDPLPSFKFTVSAVIKRQSFYGVIGVLL